VGHRPHPGRGARPVTERSPSSVGRGGVAPAGVLDPSNCFVFMKHSLIVVERHPFLIAWLIAHSNSIVALI